MNFSLANLKILEFNQLTDVDNYLPDYQPNVKRIITIALGIIFTLLIIGISIVIVTAILSQPLCLLGLLATICLLIPTIVIAYRLLKKYSGLSYNTQNLSLDAVTNFSIKEKTADSLTLTVHINNSSSKEIVFISRPFSQVLKNLPHTKKNVPGKYSPIGYVCVVNKNGSSLYPFKNKTCLQEIQKTWKKAQNNTPFSVGQTTATLFFTGDPSPQSGSQNNSEQQENSYTSHATSTPGQQSSPTQSATPSYLFLIYPNNPTSLLASFREELKISYRNIFETATQTNVAELRLPLLGINPSLLEGSTISRHKNIFSSKILLQSVFEEIKKSSSIKKVVVFIDKNSMIEEILYSKMAVS